MESLNSIKKQLVVEPWPIDRLIPYARNPRKNDEQVDRMCGAIREFGFRIPIVAKSDGTVVDGHLRLKAAQKLGLQEVPVALADELTDTQVKAFRLLANQSANWAEWDTDLLKLELEDLKLENYDLELAGFDNEELDNLFGDEKTSIGEDVSDDENIYTSKVTTPNYEPTGREVALGECYGQDKYQELMQEISAANISQDEKLFLQAAATRHIEFNYENIAEFYASKASPEMQRLMEHSALVIIDKDDAIANGFVELTERVKRLMGC